MRKLKVNPLDRLKVVPEPSRRIKSQESRVLGFTLIELIVGAGLFVTAVVGLSSLFVGILRIQRQAFLESLVIDNTRYAMEEMARAIRVSDMQQRATGMYPDILLDNQPMLGGAFGCDTPTGCRVFYQRDAAAGVLRETRTDPPLVSEFDLAGDQNIAVELFNVMVWGCEGSDERQPRVSIALQARPHGMLNAPSLPLATTVSLRTVRDTCD